MEHIFEDNKKKSFTDLMRVLFRGILEPIASFLNRIGLKPNTVTISGLVGHAVAAYLIARGYVSWGGLLILLMAPVDALDGTMARLLGEPSAFGSFVDSVTDRYSELVLFGGLLMYFLQQQNWLGCGLVYLAAAGSVLVSYTRAKAEALGFDSNVGILTRFERYLVLVPALIFNLPLAGTAIIGLLANLTALQRVFYIRKQAHSIMHKES